MSIPRVVMAMVCDFKYLPPAYNEGLILSQNGYTVEVFTLRDKDELAGEQINGNYTVHRIHLWMRPLPKNHFFWMFKYIEYVIRFLLLEAPGNASVYVAHNFDALLPVYFIAKLKRAKVLYHAHELYTEAFELPLQFFWKWLERQLLRRVDGTISPNDERAEIMYREYGARTKPFVVMNCPHYTPPIKSTALQDYLKERNFPYQFVVLFQGRIISYNGVEELIESAQYFDRGISLVLLGPTTLDYQKLLESMIDQKRIKDRVVIHKPVPYTDLPQYTASANIGMILYRNINRNSYFCAPNKLFEYFMAGLPVISSNFPGLIRLVSDAGCGLVVEPDDPMKIAEAVNFIYNNHEKAELMRTGALKSAEKYSWENEGKKLLMIYENLLK